MLIHVNSLDEQEILRYLGHRSGQVPEEMDQTIRRCIKETLETIQPQAIYQRFPIRTHENGIHVVGTSLILAGTSIRQHLAPVSEVWLMAVTIGPGMDKLIRSKLISQPAEGVIFDSCGAAAVEAAADTVQESLRIMAQAEEKFITTRFSPGYGDLPLSIQKDFLTALDAPRKIGLSVTDSSLMTPSKSVTAIIGISDERITTQQNPCDACKLRMTCELRKAGTPCWK